MSVHTIAPAWQHPYVNVFKLCEVDQLKDVLVQGDVTEAMDRIIGKKVFKLRGTIPANNFLQVPKRRSTSLGLNGPFLYIQFKASPVKVFIIHVDLLTHDGNVHRVSISNMYSPDSIKRKSSGIQIPFPSPSHRWCVLALDMVAVLAGFSASPFASLRSLTLCSWLIVRSIYTSELKFSLQNLPRDMALSHALDTSVFEMHWLPSEPPMPDAQIMPVKPMGAAPVSSPESPRPTSPRAPRVHTGPPIVSSQFDAVPPAMTLERINNFTGEFTQVLAWAPGGRDELVFAAASTAIAMRADGSTQRFFFGHTAHVAGLAFDAAGGIMATIQEGKQAVVRVWDFDTGACAAVLNAHASGLVCVSVSPDGRALAAVGQDAHNRQTIVVWDISKLRLGGMAEVVTRHTTDFNVRVLRFSEFEEDQLVAAGRDSIRFYRLKAGQLRGVSVRLSAPGRRVTSYAGGISAAPGPNIFTDVAFECGGGMLASDVRRVFVSSASGAVFEINCNTRELLCIYQLHPSAINSISVTDSFCVTAGDDALMRVWPLDFSDYLLEAAHEGPVTSCGVSADGLTVCIGTEGGALGVLHIPSQAYRTLLRSHTAAVHAVAADPNRPHYVTAGADSTIRMWDVNTHEQLLEFDAPGEVVTSVAYHPTHHEIACGFGNGRTRVFDIGATTLVKEHSQHKGEVTQLLYSPDGWWLYSAGNDGGLCVYDVAQVYAPIKFLSAGGKHAKMCVAVSADGRYVATTSRDAHTGVTSLLLFHGDSLEPYMRIETDADAFTKLAFSSDAAELWALAQPSRLDRFELTEGRRVQSAGNPHRLDALVLASDPCGAFMVTAGLDQHVKLWGVSSGVAMALERGAPSAEDFIGHPAPVYGAAFLGADRLITVGDACSVMVWRLARGGDAGRQGVGSSRSQAWEKAKAQQHPSAAAAGGGAAGGSGRASWEGAQTQRHPSATAAAAAAAAAAQQRRGSGNPAAAPPDGMPPSPPPPQPRSSAPQFSTAARPPHTSSPHTASSSPHTAAPQTTASKPTPTPGEESPSARGPVELSPRAAAMWSPTGGSTRGSGGSSAKGRGVGVAPPPAHSAAGAPQSPRAGAHASAGTSAGAAGAAGAAARGNGGGPWPDGVATSLVGYTPSGYKDCVWAPGCGVFAYVVNSVVVLEDLATRLQKQLCHHTQRVSCLALSSDASLLAVASSSPEPSSGLSDVVVWDLECGLIPGQRQQRSPKHVLSYHPSGVQALAFTADRKFLASVGQDPERSVVVWDLTQGCIVSAGRTPRAAHDVAWLAGTPLPQFVTAGDDGLLLWTLRSDCLELAHLQVAQEAGLPVPCTALACEGEGTIITAVAGGAIYQVSLRPSDPCVSVQQVADMGPDARVTALVLSPSAAVVGTRSGAVASFGREGALGVWQRRQDVSVDGPVTSLSMEPSGEEVVASSASASIWYLGLPSLSRVPLVAGHSGCITGLAVAPDVPGMMASTADDGALRVWQAHGSAGHAGAEMLAEFQSPAPCTASSFLAAPDYEGVVAGYADGSLRLFSLRSKEASLKWATHRHSSSVVAVCPHPSRPLLLSACAGGSLAVTARVSSRMVVYVDSVSTAAGPDGLPVWSGRERALQDVALSWGSGSMVAAAWTTHFVVFTAPWEESSVTIISKFCCEEGGPGDLSSDLPACIAFVPRSPRSLVYASPLLLGKALLFDYRRSTVVRQIGLTQMVRCMSIAPDGRHYAFGGQRGSVFLVDPLTGVWSELSGHTSHVGALAFSSDGRHLVSASGSAMCVWGVAGHFEPTQEQLVLAKIDWTGAMSDSIRATDQGTRGR